jgi:hypothetical protein
MITGFEFYTPEAWIDESGLIVSGKPHKVTTNSQKGAARRSGRWDVIISSAVGGACLAISSLLLATPAASAATAMIATDHDLSVVKTELPQDVELSPIHAINQTFNKLFDSVRTGQKLIPSDNVRLLAHNALQSQKENEDIDSWARNLVNDIKDAND